MATKVRLDQALVSKGMVTTRSQAESFIKLGVVVVNGRISTKPGLMVNETDNLELATGEQYVSRAGLKLSSVAKSLQLEFSGKVVLDVGSSTGGFTDYALQHQARKVIAVDVGTDQMHPRLRGHSAIELHEKTDIRDLKILSSTPDIVVIDVSFVSIRDILPAVGRLCTKDSLIAAMIKPQFEAVQSSIKHKGVIKNDKIRREIFKSFEEWVRASFKIIDKADSEVSGAKGNRERFYLLRKID